MPGKGITMYTALVSLFTGVPVRPDVAMTGEITLRGNVLQIGGVEEKLLAAHRAGIKRVIIPERNMKDLNGAGVTVGDAPLPCTTTVIRRHHAHESAEHV